jgi:hypothetical protein
MDIGGTNGGQVGVCNYAVYYFCNSYYPFLPATMTWSADQTTVFIVPTSPLAVGTQYDLASFNLTDLDGNSQGYLQISFSTAFTANTNAPTVINTSRENTETAVPVNSPVQILFNEPIQPTSIGQSQNELICESLRHCPDSSNEDFAQPTTIWQGGQNRHQRDRKQTRARIPMSARGRRGK